MKVREISEQEFTRSSREKGEDSFELCLEVELAEIAEALDVESKRGGGTKVSGLSDLGPERCHSQR